MKKKEQEPEGRSPVPTVTITTGGGSRGGGESLSLLIGYAKQQGITEKTETPSTEFESVSQP